MESKYIHGIFKCELKNRFLCLVSIDDKDTICYIPSSSRLENFIDLQGKEVLLVPTESKTARTKYAVYAIKKKQNYIILNTSVPNRIINKEIHNRRFSFLGKRNNVSREKRINEYKCDLFIEDTQTIVEIKSIITENSSAVFPAVHSDRAISQLREISALLENGYKAYYCFVSLNPYVKEIKINEQEKEFYELFNECIEKGMLVSWVALEMKNEEPRIKNQVRVISGF